jgi:cleavage and polyadenylation specificity factor subunit 1
LTQNSEKASPRQCRHLNYIGQFSTDIRHIAGIDNVVADMLSRIEEISMPKIVDLNEMAKQQSKDQEILLLMNDPTKSSLQLRKVKLPNTDESLYCDTANNIFRPFVPKSLRKAVINQHHGLSHPGVKATRKMVSRNFVWPFMNSDCTSFVRSCPGCQTSKVHKHNKTSLGDIISPNERFKHIHIDIVGPLPISEGYRYVLTMIDRYSRWPEAIPIPDQTAITVVRALHDHWISRFGVPDKITTDRGRQFESDLFRQLMVLYGSHRIHTSAYNPKANGLVERIHRTMKAAIMAHANSKWTESISTVMLGLRSTIREDIKHSPAEMLYGESISLPGAFFAKNNEKFSSEHDFVENLRNVMKNIKTSNGSRHCSPSVYVEKSLASATHVYVRKDAVRASLEKPYEGPFEVVEKHDKYFKIKRKNKQENVSVDRIKAAYIVKEESDNNSKDDIITKSGHRIRFMIQ